MTAQYLTAITHAWWAKLSAKQIVSLKDQGVEPEYPRQIHALGMGPYTTDQIVRLYEMLKRLGGPKDKISMSEFFLYTKRDVDAMKKVVNCV